MESSIDLNFDFGDLIGHANITEKRAVEMNETGGQKTPYLNLGDTASIEAFNWHCQSKVTKAESLKARDLQRLRSLDYDWKAQRIQLGYPA